MNAFCFQQSSMEIQVELGIITSLAPKLIHVSENELLDMDMRQLLKLKN